MSYDDEDKTESKAWIATRSEAIDEALDTAEVTEQQINKLIARLRVDVEDAGREVRNDYLETFFEALEELLSDTRNRLRSGQ